MKIYTKSGDTGETSILKGRRIAKSEVLIEANGALDEASSFIGWARETVEDERMRTLLTGVQHDLYEIMGMLAGASISTKDLEARVVMFERFMDGKSRSLPALHRFILPQGGETATRFHIARTVVRSAERRVVKFARERSKYHAEEKKSTREPYEMSVIRYLNRLSDLLFILARTYAQVERKT